MSRIAISPPCNEEGLMRQRIDKGDEIIERMVSGLFEVEIGNDSDARFACSVDIIALSIVQLYAIVIKYF